MAKDYETYEGRRVYVAATSYQLAQEVNGAWAGRESPYVVKIPDGAAAVKSGALYFESRGEYSSGQVIEEYIKNKLDAGPPFNSISPIKGELISEYPAGVSIGSGKDTKPYSFNHKGKDYYVTTQLRDNEPKDNFQRFRTIVSAAEPSFIITPIVV